MFKKKPNNNPNTLVANHISENTVVNGNIEANSDMRIDGNVKGNITSNSKVVTGKTSSIIGNVKCTDLTIEGTLYGDVTVENLLHITQTATFEGNIKYGKLIIEENANIVGTLTQSTKKVPISDAQINVQQTA